MILRVHLLLLSADQSGLDTTESLIQTCKSERTNQSSGAGVSVNEVKGAQSKKKMVKGKSSDLQSNQKCIG